MSVMDRIPFLGCINLIERDDRYAMISEEFNRVGIANRVHWHRPHRHKEGGRIGCFESHLAVFQAALNAGAPFAVIMEDDVRFSSRWEEAFERLLALADSGVKWSFVSLQNTGGEVCLRQPGDTEKLPEGVTRGSFYFLRCYAVTQSAMEKAVQTGITRAHVDVALAVANWGQSFIVRPAAAIDVPSWSDNDWSEGGWQQRLAGQMQGLTIFPLLISDRWKTGVLPKLMKISREEARAWKKFMSEPGADKHIDKELAPKKLAAATPMFVNAICGG